ncbi:kinase-like domain-containing protein [Mycena galericulata]|nr:kinase-like domain-containing protein [Mycena galericulata]
MQDATSPTNGGVYRAPWFPVRVSSPSASTDYFSSKSNSGAATSQWVPPADQVVDSDPWSMVDYPVVYPAVDSLGWDRWDATRKSLDSTFSHHKLTWSQPIPLADHTIEYFAEFPKLLPIPQTTHDLHSENTESPTELRYTLSQDEVDKNMIEMTCGPKLEEHFWPIRSRIRHGKLQAYENATHALIVHARKESKPAVLCKLTSELASSPLGSALSLASFLDESQDRYDRLRQIASDLQAADLQTFREAVWGDNLMIILVFYEILTSKTDLDHIMNVRGNKAQFILDLMQDALETHTELVHILNGGSPRMRGSRRTFLNNIIDQGLLRNMDRVSAHLDARRVLVSLSEACDLLPSSSAIHGIQLPSAHPIFGGAFGDIYKAEYRGNHVALKRLRLFQTDNPENISTRLRFCREALIWKNLEHDYLLPFLGVDSESFPGFMCMVSPWMDKGPIVTARGGPDTDRIPFLVCARFLVILAVSLTSLQMYEIAVGLQYLHSQNIIHGDLRGANILIDDQGHARLADFGLTVFADGPLAPTNRGGSTRWMAPELLDPESCGLEVFQRTFATDIYSFGCVCLELYTGKAPFFGIPEGAVLLRVIKGDRPKCLPLVPDWCNQIIAKCWSHLPGDRPGTVSIIESIVESVQKRPRSILQTSEGSSFRSPARSALPRSKSHITCFKCHQLGHYQNECLKPGPLVPLIRRPFPSLTP